MLNEQLFTKHFNELCHSSVYLDLKDNISIILLIFMLPLVPMIQSPQLSKRNLLINMYSYI